MGQNPVSANITCIIPTKMDPQKNKGWTYIPKKVQRITRDPPIKNKN